MIEPLTYIAAYFGIALFGFSLTKEGTKLRTKVFLGFLAAVCALVHFALPFLASGQFLKPAIEVAICFLAGRTAGKMNSSGAGLGVMVLCIGLATGLHFTLARKIRAYGGQFAQCCSNLKNMGTAMEMYSTDWSGKYPSELSVLAPNYLRTVPECPAAGSSTYTLQTGPDAPRNKAGWQDYYFLQCEGSNHGSVNGAPNFPQFDGVTFEVTAGRTSSNPYSWYIFKYY